MRIGNAGIFVKDLEGAKKFFEDYFGATVLKTYNEAENNYYSYILQLDEGAWIELMTKPGIVVDTRPELDEIIKKFKQDGYKIQYEPSSPVGGGEVRAVTFEDIVLEVNYTPAA